MRRLGIFVLSILIFINIAWFLSAIALLVNEPDGVAQIAKVGLVFLFFAAFLTEWRQKLRRRVPPAHWTPPRPPRKKTRVKPASKPVIEAPAAPRERQLAPVPMARPLTVTTAPVAASMPPELQRFIEAGVQVISATPETQEAPEEEEIVPLPEPASQAESPPDNEARGRFIPPERV